MICPKCGTNNKSSSNFCEKCGYNLKSNISKPIPDNSSSNEPNNNLKYALIIGVFILIGIIGAGLIIAFSSDGDSDNDNINSNNNGAMNPPEVSYQNGFPVSRSPELASAILRAGDFSYITFDGVQLSKWQCLYILSKSVTMINNGETGSIPIKDFDGPGHPSGRISSSVVSKGQYVDMANRMGNWFDNNGFAPNFIGINYPAVNDVSPSNFLRILAYALVEYGSTGQLPETVAF